MPSLHGAGSLDREEFYAKLDAMTPTFRREAAKPRSDKRCSVAIDEITHVMRGSHVLSGWFRDFSWNLTWDRELGSCAV